MSQPDPPAPDLGARLARLHAEVDGWKAGTAEVDVEDLQAALAHIDAQAARLAAVERLVGLWIEGAEGGLETLEALEELLDGAEAAPFQAGAAGAGEGEARDG